MPDISTVVFFDICGYSELDCNAQIECVEVLESAIRQQLPDASEHVIVEGGDAFAVGFGNPGDAVKFAVGIAQAVTQTRAFSIRTGIFAAEVTVRETINGIKNMYGKGVDYAARLASCCLPGQIFVSKHVLDDNACQNHPARNYIAGGGEYEVKHGETIKVYNLYVQGDFGVPDLPLKRKKDDSSFLILAGDRRERPAKTAGDMFVATPSIDDLCHVLKFDWPQSALLRGDKIMCWEYENKDSIVRKRNLFVVGSPKVNIAALMANAGSLFSFKLDQSLYKERLESAYRDYHNLRPNNQAFLDWSNTDKGKYILNHYPNRLGIREMDDPINTSDCCIANDTESYGLISFARHPFVEDGEHYALLVAGIDLCATLTITGKFFDVDFSERPFGGVIRVQRVIRDEWPWHELPHHGKLDADYWVTPPYTAGSLRSYLDADRQRLVDQLENAHLTMTRIQELLRK